jgi:hypothetical protein
MMTINIAKTITAKNDEAMNLMLPFYDALVYLGNKEPPIKMAASRGGGHRIDSSESLVLYG